MTSVSSTSSSSSSTYSSSILSTDWSSLIESVVDAKLTTADSIETRVTANEAKISAYTSLQSLLGTLADAATALSAPSGYSTSSTDVFETRTAYLTTSSGATTSDILGVSVEAGTETGTHDITVTQLATAQKVASGSVASNSTSLGYEGVFSLGTTAAGTASITIDADMTLTDIAAVINDTSSDTGVKANILQVASGDYRLVLSSTSTGTTISASATSGDDVLAELGLTDDTGAFANTLQSAQQGIVTIDGVQITRDSNEIDDALDGVTLYLYSTTADQSSVSMEIAADVSSISDAIQTLVDAYNAYRDFVIEQQATNTDGTASDTAVLFGDSTLRGLGTLIDSALSTTIDSQSMALLGLSFDETNHLEIDSTTLNDALTNSLDEIQSLLAFSFDSSSNDIQVLRRGSSAPTSFTLDITVDESGALSSASIGGDSSLFTISGSRIVGVSGTAYDGFSFVFTGSTSQSIDVTLGYGIAEKLASIADVASDDSDGTLQTLIDNLTEKNEDYANDISNIETRAEALRTRLTTRYANYQAAIAKAESTLQYLEALLNANSD